MLSIGEFSKICRVSTKTLRYYADIGLIYPDNINPENGYRYYSIEQLKKMLFINRMKSYNFSLDEIKTILDTGEEFQEGRLLSMLRQKQKIMAEQAAALELSLNRLEKDMEGLEQGIPIMSYLDHIDAALVEVPSMCILSMRKMVSMDECTKGYGEFFGRLFQKIAVENLTMTGPPMTIYHSREYLPTGYDMEFAVPIREFVTGTRDFTPGLCIQTIQRGAYSELTSIYARQSEWAEQENYMFSKPPFEIYVTNPEQCATPQELITEIYSPVKKP